MELVELQFKWWQNVSQNQSCQIRYEIGSTFALYIRNTCIWQRCVIFAYFPSNHFNMNIRGKKYGCIKGLKHIEFIPSTSPNASTKIVCKAGMAHATKWNRCDLLSMASWPHLSPAARNQANAKQAHQANAAMQQKYNAINKIVHNVDWRCPCLIKKTIRKKKERFIKMRICCT